MSCAAAAAPELFVPVVLRNNLLVACRQKRGTKLRRAGEFIESDLPHDLNRERRHPVMAHLKLLRKLACLPNWKDRIAEHGTEIGGVELRSQKCRFRRVVEFTVVFCQAVVRRIEEFVLPFELGDQGDPPRRVRAGGQPSPWPGRQCARIRMLVLVCAKPMEFDGELASWAAIAKD